MLYIDDTLPQVQKAKAYYQKIITCFVNRKIYGKTRQCSDQFCIVCKSGIQKARISKQLTSVLRKLDVGKIVAGEPTELVAMQRDFERLYFGKTRKKVISTLDIKGLHSIFNYSWFVNKENKYYNAYQLCDNLKIETCIYCNRLYTNTIITSKKEKIIRPTLDHWFAYNEYPLLALSFYNLIPSFTPCNSSVKLDATFDLAQNIHPYVDKNITSQYQFQYTYDKSLQTYKVNIKSKNNQKLENTVEILKLKEIYSCHQSEIADLDLLRRKYNSQYLNDLGKLLDKNLTQKDVYRIFFGVEYDDENFYKRPLSKFKKDLLDFKI